MNVFKIALHNGEYSVSIPNYPGGDVVDYDETKALADELASERAKVAKLSQAIEHAAPIFRSCAADHGDNLQYEHEALALLFNALNETKPNEPKRIE